MTDRSEAKLKTFRLICSGMAGIVIGILLAS
jgi:hypothetical protein